MGNFSNINSKITAAIGALVISMAFITAAVGPAASTNGNVYASAQVLVQEQQA
jgi:hypothetical protein